MNKPTVIGAIAGDVLGSVFEWHNVKSTDFKLFDDKSDFTDDTVLTMAVLDVILNNKDYAETIWEYGNRYKGRGYGGRFAEWLNYRPANGILLPYGSYGNGSGMRVSPVGFAYNNLDEVLVNAKRSAEVTHNHIEGIKGAQAIATAILKARADSSKDTIRETITTMFGYNLNRTIDEIRPDYRFHVSCQRSCPEAIIAFLESRDYESAIRLAISIGGDSDTIACMTGGIASAYYKDIPEEILKFVESRLPEEWLILLNEFDLKFA
jgi:ADP-ribosylglycohydrolase